jgi:hypothetical protein
MFHINVLEQITSYRTVAAFGRRAQRVGRIGSSALRTASFHSRIRNTIALIFG